VPPTSRPERPRTQRRGVAVVLVILVLLVCALAAQAVVATIRGLRRAYPLRLSSYPSAHLTGGLVANDSEIEVRVRFGKLESPVRINEGATVAELVQRQQGALHEADRLWPNPAWELFPGAVVSMDRSVPLTIISGNRSFPAHAHGITVGEGLADCGIYLVGRDYSIPSSETRLRPHQSIVVNRVRETVEIEQETTDFETLWEDDPNLEIDRQRLVREGQEGILRRRYRVVEINGEQVSRKLEDEWLQQEPIDRLMAYGTKLVERTVDTPLGPQTYWRRIRVLVTSYSPSTAGHPPGHPHYGITRTGKRADTGMIAVDPSVIPLGTRIYVPGYGIGIAEDTGSAIIGKHVDLCYRDEDLVLWHKWVDIYLLTPAPPEHMIRWVLPNWPPERR